MKVASDPLRATATDAPALLVANRITKRFGGIQALSEVSFTIREGEIYGLIGPNGAGKTSLFNVLTGIYPADDGEFVFEGQSLAGLKPHQVAACGIARTFQNIRLFANLSALENVMIGRHVRTRTGVFGAILRRASRSTLPFGISGIVSAFDAKSGKRLWQTPAPKEAPFYGAAVSPLAFRDPLDRVVRIDCLEVGARIRFTG